MSKEEEKSDRKEVDIHITETHNFNVNGEAVEGEYEEYGGDDDDQEIWDPSKIKLYPKNEDYMPIYRMFRDSLDIDGLVLLIVGEKRSGKTALAWTIFDNYNGDRHMVAFKHPNPEKVKQIITKHNKKVYVTHDFNQVIRNNNWFIWIDEPQIVFPDKDKLLQFLTICGHHNHTVLFSSCDTRYFTIALEFHIDGYFIKDCDWEQVKRGSKITKIVRPYLEFGIDDFSMDKNQFLFYSRKVLRQFNNLNNDVYMFSLPSFFDDSLSKPFSATMPRKPTKLEQIKHINVEWD